jgi:hypothetical protein
LLSTYKRFIRLRQSEAALSRGDVEVLESGSPQVLAFTRTTGDGKSLLVVANLSEQAVSEYGVKLPAACGGVPAQDDLVGSGRVNASAGAAYSPVGELKPQQVLVRFLPPRL